MEPAGLYTDLKELSLITISFLVYGELVEITIDFHWRLVDLLQSRCSTVIFAMLVLKLRTAKPTGMFQLGFSGPK